MKNKRNSPDYGRLHVRHATQSIHNGSEFDRFFSWYDQNLPEIKLLNDQGNVKVNKGIRREEEKSV